MSEDWLDTMEESVENIFSVNRYCFGDPGEWLRVELPSRSVGAAPLTLQLRLPKPSANSNYLMAHFVWKSSILLAKLVSSGAVNVDGKKVIELGAGAGLPSFSAAFSALPYLICITDYPDSDILDNIRYNLRLFEEQFCPKPHVSIMGYKWGDPIENIVHDGRLFDIILLADTFWLASEHDNLISSILALLTKNGQVFLACCNHGVMEVEMSSLDNLMMVQVPVKCTAREQLLSDRDLSSTALAFLEKCLLTGLELYRMPIPLEFLREFRNVAFYRMSRKM